MNINTCSRNIRCFESVTRIVKPLAQAGKLNCNLVEIRILKLERLGGAAPPLSSNPSRYTVCPDKATFLLSLSGAFADDSRVHRASAPVFFLMAMASTAPMSHGGKKAGTLVVIIMKAVSIVILMLSDLEKPPESPENRKAGPVLHCPAFSHC